MKFRIFKNSKIYIYAPSNTDTGGPTDLHQLALVLRKKFKKKAYMYYFPSSNKNPVHKNYKIFRIPFVTNIEDTKRNVLIIPEFFQYIENSKKYKNIQKGLWWLSVDFFLYFRFIYKNHSLIRSLIKVPYNLIFFLNKLTLFRFGNISLFKYLKFIYLKLLPNNFFKIDGVKVNLVHSDYQFHALKDKKISSNYLSDYIRDEYFIASKKITIKNKKNIICYNPKKSSVFFQQFIKINSDLKFVPLINLNLKEMISVLSTSKIYMDFGFHPGQDHLPREAAILKNCVITNKEGSAALYNDVPIRNEFKFDEKNNNFIKMRSKINLIFNNYSKELEKFRYYRKYLNRQKKTFENQIYKIFF